MPGKDSSDLPEFERPPVIETILGVHFKPIRGLTTAHLGLFWKALGREEWPNLRELGSIVPQIERFDVSPSAPLSFMLQQMERPEVRLRLSNEDETKVIQVQPNLLQTHWVRKSGAVYPRYTQSTKPGFIAIWANFCAFLKGEGLSSPDLLQWEVTYINSIPAGESELWRSPEDWSMLFNGVLTSPAIPDGTIESARAHHHYRLRNDQGRLHVEVRHVLSGDGSQESLDVTFTARGPIAVISATHEVFNLPKIEQRISEGFDVGRSAIVNGFAAFGSKQSLKFWGYKQENVDV